MRIKLVATLSASLLSISMADAQSTEAKLFGARPAIGNASLSPDGQRVALVVPAGARGTAVVVSHPDGSPLTAILKASGDPEKITSCGWSTNTRLICLLYTVTVRDNELVGISRIVAINADGSRIQQLTAAQNSNQLYEVYFGGGVLDWLPDDKSSAILMTRYYAAESTTGTVAGRFKEGMGVERVDTVSLKRTNVEPPRATAVDFVTDGHGELRILGVRPRAGTGYFGRDVVYTYRQPGSSDWKPLSTVKYTGYVSSGFEPYAVDRDLNVVYGFDDRDGHSALFKIALDGSMKRELVLGRNDVDVDELVRIGRQQRVVGVSYAAEQRRVEYFDPQLRALSAALSKALPGFPMVNFADASLDEQKLLISATGDSDPGNYYLLDRTTRHMAAVSPVRPELVGHKLATVKPIVFKAADGTSIPGYLTLPPGSDGKNLPAIVMPHGGPSARDEWGFDWLSQFFASRGYAVLQPNYRGSSGYGVNWLNQNGFKSWRTAMGDINDGARWLQSQGIAAPGKLAIVGWSYGGYAALQTSVLDPDLYRAIVAIAPVTDLGRLRAELEKQMGATVTKDYVDSGALAKEGSPAQNAERIKAPVLLFHGDRDLNVAISQSRLMADKLRGAGKQVELTEYRGLDHQLDDSEVRAGMLDKIDTFLRGRLGL